MVLCTTVRQTRELVADARREGLSIGLVPTMGYLHEGHLALVRQARAECGFVVVSIFVNPLQFGPGEDLAAYPRDLQRDLALCEGAGADLGFNPAAAEMYPPGFRTHVEVEGLGRVLCGVTRPGHFRGVTTVVTKLFNVVQPDRAYFGQKDYQQTLVLRRMVADLSFGLEVVVVPTMRHEDGLAMSSRNVYLSADGRVAATVLFETLQVARELIAVGERDGRRLQARLKANVEAQPLARVDYVTVADPETLEPVPVLAGTVLVALAVFIGRTRLIDNALIAVPR